METTGKRQLNGTDMAAQRDGDGQRAMGGRGKAVAAVMARLGQRARGHGWSGRWQSSRGSCRRGGAARQRFPN
jgi:hypothetical protein